MATPCFRSGFATASGDVMAVAMTSACLAKATPGLAIGAPRRRHRSAVAYGGAMANPRRPPWHRHGSAMAPPWPMATSWRRHGGRHGLPWLRHAFAIALPSLLHNPWRRHGGAMAVAMVLLWIRRGSAMTSTWLRHGLWRCHGGRHGFAMAPPWARHGSASKRALSWRWYDGRLEEFWRRVTCASDVTI